MCGRLLQNKDRNDAIEQALLEIADMERSRMKEEQEQKQEDERLLLSSRPSLSRASSKRSMVSFGYRSRK